jgi:hypothetical protein
VVDGIVVAIGNLYSGGGRSRSLASVRRWCVSEDARAVAMEAIKEVF